MLVVHVHVRIRPERIGDFLAATVINARASLAEPGQYARQFGRSPGTDHDAPGGGELEPHRHGESLAQPSPLSGNTTEYRTDSRGLAIISATESRQVV